MAAKPKTAAVDAAAYYEAMVHAKVAAGLSETDAREVTARQRAEDEANGTIPTNKTGGTEPEI